MPSKFTKRLVAAQFLTWLREQDSVELGEDLVAKWSDTFVECDVMFAYGRGHQSMSVCERTEADHTHHVYEDMEIDEARPEHYDARLSDQIYTRTRDGKVFRLAFHDRGWY